MHKLFHILKGLMLSLVVGYVSAIFFSIILAVLNIYLVGSKIYIFEKDISSRGIFVGGVDDLILIIVTLVIILTTFLFYIKKKPLKKRQE